MHMQAALKVKPNTTFVGCSDKVASALGPDVMKSVKHLMPDLLAWLPILLYQGTLRMQHIVNETTYSILLVQQSTFLTSASCLGGRISLSVAT